MFVITTRNWTHRSNDIKSSAEIIYGETGDKNDYDRMLYVLANMEFGEVFHGKCFIVQCFED